MTEYERIPADVLDMADMPRWVIYLLVILSIFCMVLFFPLSRIYGRILVRHDEER